MTVIKDKKIAKILGLRFKTVYLFMCKAENFAIGYGLMDESYKEMQDYSFLNIAELFEGKKSVATLKDETMLCSSFQPRTSLTKS